MKEKFQGGWLDHNLLKECSQKLIGKMNEFEEKIKELKVNVEILTSANDEFEKEIERLQMTNKESMEEIKKLKEENEKLNEEKKKLGEEKKQLGEENKKLVEENKKLKETYGVKLFVIYNRKYHSPACRPEIEEKGRYRGNVLSFIKCHVNDILPGFSLFEKLRDVLQRLLPGEEIREIGQFRGSTADKEVAQATSKDGDKVLFWKQSPYCDVKGATLSWEEAGKPQGNIIRAGGRVFICGRRSRTVLIIE